MEYDFSLIKITKHKEDGNAVIDLRPLFEKYEDLGKLKMRNAFAKELERLSAMPYSDDLAVKILDVIKRGFRQAKQDVVMHYAVHSTVRSRFNRTERAQAAQHARFKQHILSEQRRLIRGRPTIITERELHQNHQSLLEQHRAGILEVRTLDGRLINLETFEVSPAPPAQNPRPNPRLDSVANDEPTGIQFPKLPGGKVLSPEQVQQVVSGMASIDGDLKIDPKDGSAIVVPDSAAAPPLEELEVMGEPEVSHEEHEEHEEQEDLADDEEELEELPPGIPPPPPPPGGMPPRSHGQGKKNKHRR